MSKNRNQGSRPGGHGGQQHGNRPGGHHGHGGGGKQRQGGGHGGGGQRAGQNQGNMQYISAPYNFVPLSNFVYFPDWAEKVSHDVPFADGYSGTIECELENISPMYVRNGVPGQGDDAKKNAAYTSFFKHYVDGVEKYILPGSSIRGAIRNVLEIISFGKIGTRIDDHPYTTRDMTKNIPYRERVVGKQRTGFLRKMSDGNYEIRECHYYGVPHRMLRGVYKNKNAAEKRKSFKEQNNGSLKLSFTANGAPGSDITQLGNGPRKGVLFFAGAMNNKNREFVFETGSGKPHPVAERVMKAFQIGHSHKEQLKNLEYVLKEAKSENGAPVVFVVENGQVSSIGTAFLLRYSMPYSAVQCTYENQVSTRPDLSDLIFGYLDEDTKKGPKARAWIGPAISEAKAGEREHKMQKVVLGSPKPTYYPNYIEQEINEGQKTVTKYKSMMDKDARIRGWKRYPARIPAAVKRNGEGFEPPLKKNGEINKGVATEFAPILEGHKFSFTVSFHNLRKVELGALIQALTLGDDKLVHSIGMAKSMGYGQARIRMVSADMTSLKHGTAVTLGEVKNYCKTFTDLIKEKGKLFIQKNSRNDQNEQLHAQLERIRLFYKMCNPQYLQEQEQLKKLKQMQLPDFLNAKKAKLRLEPHA